MCDFPINIKNPLYGKKPDQLKRILVPCSKCKSCFDKRADNWKLRIYYESKRYFNAHFITLTYDTPPRTFNGLFTCDKRDVQLFLKRLRKMQHQKIKYYLASEYGEKFQRPHYHIIMFGLINPDNIQKAWSHPLDHNDFDLRGKPIGIVDIGDVTPASIRYVTGYIGKRIGIPQTDYDDRTPEFSLMSKGMGLNYVELLKDFHNETETPFSVLQGTKISTPRYLKQKIYDQYKMEKMGKLAQARYFQNEMAKRKNFPNFGDYDKNQFEVRTRNNQASKSIINPKF